MVLLNLAPKSAFLYFHIPIGLPSKMQQVPNLMFHNVSLGSEGTGIPSSWTPSFVATRSISSGPEEGFVHYGRGVDTETP